MGFLKEIFKSRHDEIWKQLSAELGGKFIDGGFWKGDKIVARAGQWTVTIDTYTVSDGETTETCFTRLRAPFINTDDFRFEIYHKSLLSDLGKMLGYQDVEVGYQGFDEDFIIKGNDPRTVKALFANARLRRGIGNQQNINLSIRDDQGWFGAEFPEGVDELVLVSGENIQDIDKLKELFDLFAEVLNQLCHIGSAYQDDPGLVL